MIEMTEDKWPSSDAALSESAERQIQGDSEANQSREQLEELRTAKQPTTGEEG